MDRLRSRVAVLAVLALTMGACGDDDGASTSSTALGATTTISTDATTTTSSSDGTSAGPAEAYDCGDLLSDAELQAAAGPSAAFLSGENWTDTPGMPEGQTYCQYFAGSTSVAVSVFTGPSLEVFLALFGAGGGESLPGIGEFAAIAPDGTAAGALTHGVGVTVIVTDLGGTGFGDFVPRDAVIAILERVTARV